MGSEGIPCGRVMPYGFSDLKQPKEIGAAMLLGEETANGEFQLRLLLVIEFLLLPLLLFLFGIIRHIGFLCKSHTA